VRDVFVKDLATGATVRASVGTAGAEATGPSYLAAISADGLWVAFESDAANLVAGDTNGMRDVFLRDLAGGTTLRVSVSSAGAQADGASTRAAVSGDGSRVAFQSDATNLVRGDTNGLTDVFLWERASGGIVRVSMDSNGAQGDSASTGASIAADGNTVLFQSSATNLVPGDTNGMADVFVHERVSGLTLRVSVGPAGVQGDNASALRGSSQISSDGRWVTFESFASNLVAGDTNGANDCFVHDRWTGTTTRVDVTTAGAQAGGALGPSLSADGRFVVFESNSSTLVPGDNNNYTDVFLRDRGTQPALQAFCFGDGVDASHTTPCPCGNHGAAARGCANSVVAAGARLLATGSAAADDVVLAGSGMPATVSCIYLQGDALEDAVFGDGVRCAGGTLLRLRTKANVGGASAFPDSTDTVTLSARGGVTVGSGVRRYYQTYYRNAAAGFCPPETFNVTNGWIVDW
jgi:hypothetical protein